MTTEQPYAEIYGKPLDVWTKTQIEDRISDIEAIMASEDLSPEETEEYEDELANLEAYR